MSHERRPRWHRVLAAALILTATATASGSATAGSAAGAEPGSTATTAATEPGPLRILLTNDDGFAAPGIRAVRGALVAAGHDVTVVAPATDQSGSSGRVTFSFGSTIQVIQREPGVWSVAGSPADSVLVGLATVFAGDPPDLVVSGSNIGQNSGGLVGHSGTVGAAVTAMEEGLPAIAVSTEIDLAAGPGATIDAFDETATLVVDTISTLQLTATDRLLPGGVGLNLNYPIVTVDDGLPDGVAFTQVGKWSFVEATYQPAGPDNFVIVPSFPAFDEPVAHADTSALRQDKISISVLDGNLGTPFLGGWSIFLRLLPLRG